MTPELVAILSVGVALLAVQVVSAQRTDRRIEGLESRIAGLESRMAAWSNNWSPAWSNNWSLAWPAWSNVWRLV